MSRVALRRRLASRSTLERKAREGTSRLPLFNLPAPCPRDPADLLGTHPPPALSVDVAQPGAPYAIYDSEGVVVRYVPELEAWGCEVRRLMLDDPALRQPHQQEIWRVLGCCQSDYRQPYSRRAQIISSLCRLAKLTEETS